VISDFRQTPAHTAEQFVTEWPAPSSCVAHKPTGAEQTAAGFRILLEYSEACKDILSIWNDGLIQNRKQSVAVAIYKNGYVTQCVELSTFIIGIISCKFHPNSRPPPKFFQIIGELWDSAKLSFNMIHT
jgi:hypothetical protein